MCGWEGWPLLTEQGGGQRWREGPSSNKHQKGSNPQDLDPTRLVCTSSDTSTSAKVVTVLEGQEK